MYVSGWCSANACIQPGIDSTGTYALETNVSGNTSSAIPCAAWALPANSPSVMNSHSNANPNTTHSPNARQRVRRGPVHPEADGEPDRDRDDRGPTRAQAVSASARPARTELRGIGSDFSRSTNPCSRSSATPVAAPMPENSTPVVTNPGTRKSTYRIPPMSIAPPNT